MGLGDADLIDDGDGGECKAATPAAAVACSICLEAVSDNGDRSWAKLQCGHQFHLDCIGSAFNIKGVMQCPNCRKIEKGQWLFANGSRPLPDFNMDDWTHDEDLYDLSYSEMSFGVHWCPFSGLTRLPSSFDEGEFSSSTYHDLVGHHAVFAEHTPVSSTTHPCPYIGYFGPIHPSSTASSTNVSDGSNYSNHWTGPSVSSEVPNSYAFPSMDVHYHSWDHSSPFTPSNQIGGADQSLITPMTQRTARNSSEIQRPGMHPFGFLLGHSSGSRAPSSATSTVLPPHPGTVSRTTRDHPSLQAYFQQSSSNPSTTARHSVVASRRRSSSRRVIGQTASSSEQSGGFYFFPNSSGRNTENPYAYAHATHRDVFHGWEVDRDSIWGPFHQPGQGAAAASENGVRSTSFRPRQGSSQNQNQNRS